MEQELLSRFEQLWSIEQTAEYLSPCRKDAVRVALPQVRSAELPA